MKHIILTLLLSSCGIENSNMINDCKYYNIIKVDQGFNDKICLSNPNKREEILNNLLLGKHISDLNYDVIYKEKDILISRLGATKFLIYK